MVGVVDRPPVTHIQYSEQRFVVVGVAPAAVIDPWAYHQPLYSSFRARRRVAELPESDFEPDDPQ